MRNERARYWPDKGSGMAPFIGLLLDRKRSDDEVVFGGMISAELCFFNALNGKGISFLLFSSYTKNGLAGGATVNWVWGTVN